MNEDLKGMSGEEYYDRPPKHLVLDEVSLNGETGTYRLSKLTGEKTEDAKGKLRYPEEDLGSEIKVVFLKIRRKLSSYDNKTKTFLTTTEHNYKGDSVALFGGGVTERGIASEIREKYPELRTRQVVYALLEEKLVRIIIKGSSLGSDNKAEGVPTFYDYVSSFKNDPRTGQKKDEHFYEYETILGSVEEVGLKTYYTTLFQKGRKLEKDEVEKAGEELKKVFSYCNQTDEFYGKEKVVEQPKEELETIEYPEDSGEIDSNEIPF